MTKEPYLLTDQNGVKYCPMLGHAQHDCTGYPTPKHIELSRQGIGWSREPGPTLAEIAEETRNDRELMLDEFHGRDRESE